MAEFFVDLSAASNGIGTEGSPYNSFQTLNTNGWVRGDVVRVKRGSSRVLNSVTRANIRCTTGTGRLLITAYGDPTLPLPVLSGGGVNFHPLWVQAGSGIDIEYLHVTNAPGTCLTIEQSEAGSTDDISDVEVRDCLVTLCGQNPALIGVDGLRVGAVTWMAGSITNIRLKRIVARDNGGHGIKVRGHAEDVTVDDCVSLRNGYLSPSHALGTSGSFVELEGPGWTNVSGQVWEKAVSVQGASSFTDWTFVHVLGAFPYYSFFLSETPEAPGPGEVGYGAPNTCRINMGGINPNTVLSIRAHYNSPRRVWFTNCVGMCTVDEDGLEGQGVFFDSGSIDCWSQNCISAYNDGQGYTMNQALNCGHYNGLGFANKKGGAISAASVGSKFHGMVLLCDNNFGVNFQTGNENGLVQMCKIVGASVGVRTNDLGSNTVDEDENVFVSCGQRLLNVSGAGARSRDEASAKPLAAQSTWTALRAALAAEQVK